MKAPQMVEGLRSEIAALIDRLADGSRDDAARDTLLDRAEAWQRERVTPLGRLRAGRALPTDVFRHARIATFPPEEERGAFLTSGTTHGARGRHPFRDLELYDRAAEAAARHALFRDRGSMRLAILAPRPNVAPESSLSYMLGRFSEWFGSQTNWLFAEGRPDTSALVDTLSKAQASSVPVAVLGTSFAFVMAEDELDQRRFSLAPGSLLMQTGGFKGRSREVEPATLRAALSRRYGVTEARIVAEYGMTELSSQMYEDTLLGGGVAERRLWVPGWIRATVVDPETLAPVPEGTVGVLRVDDLANLDTVCAVQTSDLAVRHGERLELIGRAPGAVPRGCSLAIEEALGQ